MIQILNNSSVKSCSILQNNQSPKLKIQSRKNNFVKLDIKNFKEILQFLMSLSKRLMTSMNLSNQVQASRSRTRTVTSYRFLSMSKCTSSTNFGLARKNVISIWIWTRLTLNGGINLWFLGELIKLMKVLLDQVYCWTIRKRLCFQPSLIRRLMVQLSPIYQRMKRNSPFTI